MRRQVCRRIGKRVAELGLPDLDAYRGYLEAHPEEWTVLDGFCRITISRFHRDREAFDALARDVLPSLAAAARAAGRDRLRAWSAGCASGEEPYSLTIAWRLGSGRAYPELQLEVLGTDVDPVVLARARAARYPGSVLRELPDAWREAAFASTRDAEGRRVYELEPGFREGVSFARGDLRGELPPGPFDLVLCRNLAFLYFAAPLQEEVLARLLARLRPGGALAIGDRDVLPPRRGDLVPWREPLGIYRRPSGPAGP